MREFVECDNYPEIIKRLDEPLNLNLSDVS